MSAISLELDSVEIPLRGGFSTPSSGNSTSYNRRTQILQGPLRALRLLILSVLLPGALISVPLYLRYHVYGDQLYPLGLSDMRLIDGKVSTTWCQRQVVRSNATFNAFLMGRTPALSTQPLPVTMTRHLVLEDDMKEYWGFYLLKGSIVTVSTCVRWQGASLVIIRGHRHLHECAFIGDDSSEEFEELMEIANEMAAAQAAKDGTALNGTALVKEDSPANIPGQMKRHRSYVEFHDPSHSNHANHTLLEHENHEDDDEHENDAKTMRDLLAQILFKAGKMKPDSSSSASEDHLRTHREMSFKEKEFKYLKFRDLDMLEEDQNDDRSSNKVVTVQKDIRASPTSKEIFNDVLRKLERLGDKGKRVLQKLNEHLGFLSTTEKKDTDVTEGTTTNPEMIRQMKNALENILSTKENNTHEQIGNSIKTPINKENKLKFESESLEERKLRIKRELILQMAMTEELNEHDEKGDAAIEEEFVPDGIADHHTVVNETTLNDRSNSEFWSSFSSSEERLLNCAGLILNLPLTPNKMCVKEGTHDQHAEASLINAVTYRVPSNGYYFFVFSSENEVQENYIRVHFYLQKTIYNVSNPVANCVNTTEHCSLPLEFFSDEKMVLELPVGDNDSLWNEEFVVISECEPRTAVYVVCVLSVPLAILLFAFQ